MVERKNSIDILRALAIIFMIPFHFYIYWPHSESNIFGTIIIIFGNIAAPFFIIVSGMSYNFFIRCNFRCASF